MKVLARKTKLLFGEKKEDFIELIEQNPKFVYIIGKKRACFNLLDNKLYVIQKEIEYSELNLESLLNSSNEDFFEKTFIKVDISILEYDICSENESFILQDFEELTFKITSDLNLIRIN